MAARDNVGAGSSCRLGKGSFPVIMIESGITLVRFGTSGCRRTCGVSGTRCTAVGRSVCIRAGRMVAAHDGLAGVTEPAALLGGLISAVLLGFGGASGRGVLLGGIVLACHYFLFHFPGLLVLACLRIPMDFCGSILLRPYRAGT